MNFKWRSQLDETLDLCSETSIIYIGFHPIKMLHVIYVPEIEIEIEYIADM